MVDLSFVPFGNAEETQVGNKWSFTCQHGETECQGNILDNCILAHSSDKKTALQAVVCIEQIANVNGKGFDAALTQCASTYGFSVDDVTTCQNGDEGNALQHSAAVATPGDHEYVPWLVVDGAHPGTTEEDSIFDDVFAWACKNYTGANKPAACTTEKKMIVKSINSKYMIESLKKALAYDA